MSDEQSKQPPLSERVFELWFVTLPWIVFVGVVFILIGIPFANMLTVCWVKGTDAYFHQGIRIPLGNKMHFSDGSAVPQGPLFLTYFPTFLVLVGGPSFVLIQILRYYERRKKQAGNAR